MKNQREILITLLGVLSIVIGYLVYQNFSLKKQNSDFQYSLNQEKEALQDELSIVLEDLGVKQTQNIELQTQNEHAIQKIKKVNADLEKSKQKLLTLKKELATSKENSFAVISDLRKELNGVREENKKLFVALDSIQTLNDSLQTTVAVVKSELNQEKVTNEELSKRILENSIYQISDLSVVSIEIDKKGKQKKTDKYKKVNAISLSYKVVKNNLLKGKECYVYYVLKDDKGANVQKRGTFIHNGQLSYFTDGKRLQYDEKNLEVNQIVKFEEETFKKGIYTLILMSADEKLGEKKFTLKSSFLGL